MAPRKAARKPEGRYHHGELRQALLDEAAGVVEREGVAALSLRDLARRLGVSHAAPAHHFVDKAALLVELARDGFERFAAAMEAAAAQGRDPVDRLRRAGEAYVRFAIEHPGRFRVMFGREISQLPSIPPALARAGERSFGVLVDGVEAVLARWPAGRRPPAQAVAFTCWAVAHGAATLWIDGPLRRKGPRAEARAAFESGLAFTMELLGTALSPPDARRTSLNTARSPPRRGRATLRAARRRAPGRRTPQSR